jgi:hypothetical protein
MKCLLASFKILTNLFLQFYFLKLGHLKKNNSKYYSGDCKRMSVSSFLSYMIGYFLQCQSRLSEQFRESKAAFGTTFRITGDYPKSQNKPPEKGYWKDFQIKRVIL